MDNKEALTSFSELNKRKTLKPSNQKETEIRNVRNDEIVLLRAGEIADTGMGDVRGLVGRDDVVPYAHFFRISLPQFFSSENGGAFWKRCEVAWRGAAVAGAQWREGKGRTLFESGYRWAA